MSFHHLLQPFTKFKYRFVVTESCIDHEVIQVTIPAGIHDSRNQWNDCRSQKEESAITACLLVR